MWCPAIVLDSIFQYEEGSVGVKCESQSAKMISNPVTTMCRLCDSEQGIQQL